MILNKVRWKDAFDKTDKTYARRALKLIFDQVGRRLSVCVCGQIKETFNPEQHHSFPASWLPSLVPFKCFLEEKTGDQGYDTTCEQDQERLLVSFQGEGTRYSTLFFENVTQDRLKHGAA